METYQSHGQGGQNADSKRRETLAAQVLREKLMTPLYTVSSCNTARLAALLLASSSTTAAVEVSQRPSSQSQASTVSHQSHHDTGLAYTHPISQRDRTDPKNTLLCPDPRVTRSQVTQASPNTRSAAWGKKQKTEGGLQEMPVGGGNDKNMSRETERKNKKEVNIQARYKSRDADCLAR